MENQQHNFTSNEVNPLVSLDEWEDDVLQRYPDPDRIASAKTTEELQFPIYINLRKLNQSGAELDYLSIVQL